MTGDAFNPYRPPESDVVRHTDAAGTLWRDGRRLVMERDAELPHRCVRCNAAAGATMVRLHVAWTFPGLSLLMLSAFILPLFLTQLHEMVGVIGLLALPILSLTLIVLRLTHRVVVEYGLCPTHLRIQRFWRGLAVSALASGIAMIYYHLVTYPMNSGLFPVGLALIGLGVLVGAVQGELRPRAWRFTGGRIWLAGCGRPFLESLPPKPGLG